MFRVKGSAPGARALRVISQPVLGAEAGGAAGAFLEARVVRQHLVHVQQNTAPLPHSRVNVEGFVRVLGIPKTHKVFQKMFQKSPTQCVMPCKQHAVALGQEEAFAQLGSSAYPTRQH